MLRIQSGTLMLERLRSSMVGGHIDRGLVADRVLCLPQCSGCLLFSTQQNTNETRLGVTYLILSVEVDSAGNGTSHGQHE